MSTREYIETILKLGLNEAQKGYYDKMLSDLTDIEVVPIKEVLTDSELAFVKKHLNPQMKECFRNAHLFTAAFRSECEYVEGYAYEPGLIPVEHAWNKIRGKYVDITYELALGLDVTNVEYSALGEYDLDKIYHITNQTGVYGGIYQHIYRINL